MSTEWLIAGGRMNSIASDCRMQSSDMPFGSLCGQTAAMVSTLFFEYETAACIYTCNLTCLVAEEWQASIYNFLCKDSALQSVKANEIASQITSLNHNNDSMSFLSHDECMTLIERKKRELLFSMQNNQPHPPMEPQAASEILALLRPFAQNLATSALREYSDEFLTQVRGAIDFFYIVFRAPDFAVIFAALDLYLTGHHKTDLLEVLKGYITGDKMPQDAPEGNRTWADMVTHMREDWSKVKFNPFFKHVSKMLGVVAALEICRAKDLEFSFHSLKIVAPDLEVKQGDAFDLIEAVLSTVDYMIRMYTLCAERGSLEPLLLNESEAYAMDDEYALLVSLWPLVQNGNLEREKQMDEEDYHRRLDDLTRKLRNLLPSLKGIEKATVEAKYIKTLSLMNDYSVLRVSSGLKREPFVIEYFGTSGVGKSTVADLITEILLANQDLPLDPKYRWTYNMSDKYMSGVDSTKLVALLDDFGNAKATHSSANPCQTLIEIANPTGFTPNMASLHEKGRITPRFELINITTNFKELAAQRYSECPPSIQRRAHAVITTRVKKKFQLINDAGKCIGIDKKKVRSTFSDEEIDDIWYFDVEQVASVEDLKTVAPYQFVQFKGRKLQNIDIHQLIEYLVFTFDEHRKMQSRIMTSNNTTKEMIRKKYGRDTEKKPHFAKEIADALYESRCNIIASATSKLLGFEQLATDATTEVIRAASNTLVEHWDWLWFVPTPWIYNQHFMRLMMFIHKDKLERRFAWHSTFIWGFAITTSFCMFMCEMSFLAIIFVGILALSIQKWMVENVTTMYQNELIERSTLTDTLQTIKNEHIERVLAASAFLAFFYGMSEVYRKYRENFGSPMAPQGSLAPTTPREVAQRDAEENVWSEVTRRPLPMQDAAKGSIPAHLQELIEGNLVYGSVFIDNEPFAVNLLYLDTGVAVIPQHYFTSGGDDLRVECRRKNPVASSGTFTLSLGIANAYFVPNSDIAIVVAAGGGDFAPLWQYLPTEHLSLVDFNWTYRNKDGSVVKAKGLACRQRTGHSLKSFDGLEYKSLTINTRGGDCGAVLAATHKSLILGFHVGGKAGTFEGCASTVLKKDWDAFQPIREAAAEGVRAGSTGRFDPHIMGKQVLLGGEPHKKSPVRYMPKGSQIRWIGNCIGHSTFKSDVEVTPISEYVVEFMSFPNIYCGPLESPQWKGWQTCLENLSLPADPFPSSLLQTSFDDYIKPLLVLFESELWNGTVPLSDLENMNGIPGRKFIDRIKLNTAIGFPETGTKNNFVIELEPIEPYTKIVEFNDKIQQEIDRMVACYKRGERAYPIAKACKKDEILSKLKNRIFYANSAGLTFLIRKYFLPLIRVLQMNPLLSECAVGINSHGPEWEQLHQFLHKYGDERLFGGDYSKYDQKLPAQLLFAAFKVLITLARVLPGYSDEDIAIMEAMTADVVYAIIAFNGDLIALTAGGHISGNSLTVILNGICGSLNLRCCFFSKYSADMNFRDCVNLVTYGDDNAGCVRPDIEFGTLTCSKFLAKYNQTYTRPDKEEATSEFLEPELFDFIKRKSVFIPEIGMHVGALDEASCAKMLHCYLRTAKSKMELSEDMACKLNIETAAREWFNHGREVFELRREQLWRVARAAKIDHLCNELKLDFDDRVKIWKKKYQPDETSGDVHAL
ncbi:nonstructural polyprotein [Cylindrotheca closterium RNA virus 03]|nr:nonstructural polyprotein [Cylindrotheca closterium RNA virus 03]